MNNLLLFFAFPVSTIILSIVLQKILKNTLLTAATFFAIYLIISFTAFDINFLVYTIIYTILAYITAEVTKMICIRNKTKDFEENKITYSYKNNEIYDDSVDDLKINNYIEKNQKRNCYRR